jgi:hypothetical protein
VETRESIISLITNPKLLSLPNSLNPNDDLSHYLDGYDFIISNKKDKLSYYDYEYSNYKWCYELDCYLNANFWRLSNLIDGAIISWKADNLLSGIINLRHLYETIVHMFYLIKKLEMHLKAQDGEKFYHLLWTFTFTFSEYLPKQHEKEEFKEQLLTKLPHINDSLRFYLKEANTLAKIGQQKEKVFPTDILYRQISQMAHPNSMGALRFFGKEYSNKVLFQNVQHEKNHPFYLFFFGLTIELSLFASFLVEFEKTVDFYFPELVKLNKINFDDFRETKDLWYAKFNELNQDNKNNT